MVGTPIAGVEGAITMGRFTVTRSVKERLLANIKIYPDGCWFWKAAKSPGGYGVTFANGRRQMAHRVSYELFREPIPDGLVLDHLCGHPYCVNPDHLEAVTERTNILRSSGVSAHNAKKTHCPKGHPYSPENTATGRKGLYRRCKTCIRERWHTKERPLREAERKARMASGLTPVAVSPHTGKVVLGGAALSILKTHCPQGHEYTEQNTFRGTNGGRACRACKQERTERRRIERQEAWRLRLGLDRPPTFKEINLATNSITAQHARVTRCPRGHAYDESNTYLWRGRRYCRSCHVENERNRRARKGAALTEQAS